MAMAPATADTRTGRNIKQQFLDVFDTEHAKTMRVLRAYPTDKLDLRPHTMCKNARELAFMFALEAAIQEKVLTTGLDLEGMRAARPAPPDAWDGVLDAVEQGYQRLRTLVNDIEEDRLYDTFKFFTGPKTIGDYRKIDFLWMLLHDQIHHRGQFSIYLRMAGGKVPSIYGPSADEPWT